MRYRRGRSSLSNRVPRSLGGAVLLVASFGVAGASCSGGDSTCESNRTFFEQNVWSTFMGSQCTKCHAPDGTAVNDSGAKFVLQPNTYPGFVDANLANLTMLSGIQYQGKSELLLKPIGQMNHGGGAQLGEGSAEYKALSELVDRLSNTSATCTEKANTTLSTVQLATGPSTLRRAAIDLVGRLPTSDETAKVTAGGDVALDVALDAIMREDAFYDRVREMFNDTLLTDQFLENDDSAISFMNTDDYPGLAPYRDDNNPKYKAPERPLINQALAREPLDLIVYVLKNNKPFTDVVAANYAVVNPFTAIAYNVQSQVTFKDPTNYNEFHEAHVNLGSGAAVPNAPIPHSGVLSTPSFLNRWTTSPTNRNRGRARRVFKFFLATDILKIAERPVDATKVTAQEDPTRNSSYCTVCHKVIDPVAGGFRGYDDQDYEDFNPMAMWHDDMYTPGFAGENMDPSYYGKALTWLGPKIANDPRFLISAVQTVYKGLTGRDPILYPPDNKDPNFKVKLDAWEAQDAFFRQTAEAFQKGNYNLRDIFKAVIKSPYYRGVWAPSSMDPNLLQDIGVAQLLTPEALSRKIKAVTGYSWRQEYDWNNKHEWLMEDYKILYGGIDSVSTISRLTAPNGLISSVAQRMANETSCRITAWDFTKGKALRKFFPYADPTEVPESSGHTVNDSVLDIKKNIQHLHKLFLDEDLAVDDAEIVRTYQLFLDTWHELAQAGDTGLSNNCSGSWDPTMCDKPDGSCGPGADLPDMSKVTDDKNFTIRSWMAVVTYLLSDYRFLYK